jgi:hypothetical protein
VHPSRARAGAPAACAAPVVNCLAVSASAPAPGGAAPVTGASSGDGGASSHLSGGACPLTSSSSSSSSDDEYSSVPDEESPCCSRSRYSSLLRLRRSLCRVARSLFRATRARSRSCTARASARERGVGGTDFAAFTLTSCKRTLRCVNNPGNWQNRSEIKNSTHQLAGGQHLKIPQGPVGTHGLGVDGASRPGSRVIPQEGTLQRPRPRQRDGVRRLGHLEDAERPLYQGDDLPVVDLCEDDFRGQPAARQIPQRGEERVQPPLVLERGHPVVPGVGPLPEHQAGVGGRPSSSLRR